MLQQCVNCILNLSTQYSFSKHKLKLSIQDPLSFPVHLEASVQTSWWSPWCPWKLYFCTRYELRNNAVYAVIVQNYFRLVFLVFIWWSPKKSGTLKLHHCFTRHPLWSYIWGVLPDWSPPSTSIYVDIDILYGRIDWDTYLVGCLN